MFTKRTKRHYQAAIWTAVVICLCALILYFAWPADPKPEPSVSVSSVENQGLAEPSEESDEMEEPQEEEDGTLSENEETGISPPLESYYLVKRAGTEIVVFFCDARGNMVQLETTEILYDLLGPEDQELFDQGIRITSQEELSILLQDFEG